MARYLLSSRTILDIIQKKGLPGERWLIAAAHAHNVIARDLCVSAVTPMAVRRELAGRIASVQNGKRDPQFSHDDLLQMVRNAEALWREFAAEDRIVPMTASIATRWGELLDQAIEYVHDDGTAYQIGSVHKLEIATAIVGRGDIGYVYVERTQASHEGLNGLAVEDPTDAAEGS